MALVACPDCGTEISDQAPACVRCGRPMRVSDATRPPAQPVALDRRGSAGNILAALVSLVLPGLGQLLQARLGVAVLSFFAAGVLYVIGFALMVKAQPIGMLLPLMGHILAAGDAAVWAGPDARPLFQGKPDRPCPSCGELLQGFRHLCPHCGVRLEN